MYVCIYIYIYTCIYIYIYIHIHILITLLHHTDDLERRRRGQLPALPGEPNTLYNISTL